MQNLPIITNPQDVSIYQVERKSIFRYLKQFEELFEKETGSKELSLFLAEPEVNDFTKQISWSTKAEGPIRNMSQLSPEERVYVAGKIQEYTDQIRVIANKLAVTKGLSTFITAEILDNLLVTRELPEAIFLVGNQVVMTEWGCAPYGRYDRKNFALTKQITKIDPTYIAPVVVEPTIVPVEDIVAATPARSLWRWLVILLLASLLVFGLSLKSCSRFNAVDNGAEESALRAEINSLWIKVKEKADACFPKKEEVPPPVQSPLADFQEKFRNKDLSVFEGNWVFSGTNLVVASTGERIVMQLKFARDGSAVSSVATESGDFCSAGATAVINSDTSFTVNTQTLNCKKGGTYTMSGDGRISCKVRSNYTQADCTLVCKSGSCAGVFERK
jgi:hypothetical protein